MKILLLSFYYPPDLSAGSFRMKALVDSLIAKDPDINITIITTMPNRYDLYKVSTNKHEISKNVNIYRVPLPKHNSSMYGQIISFWTFARYVLFKVKNQDYNLIFATSSRLMTAFLGALISKKFKVPLYLDIRDLFSDSVSDVYNKKIPRLFLLIIKYIERWSFKTANTVNLVSKGFIEDAKKISKNTKYTVFTNGIDDIFLNKDYKNKVTISLPITILYAGNIGEGQGLHKILPDLAKGIDGKAVIKVVGSGSSRAKLEDQLIKQNVTNVELIDPVSRKDLFSFYSEADVLFLHLNDFDAFKKVLPSKLFEYAATEKYILAGVGGYADTFLNDSIEGVKTFKPCDVDEALYAFNSFNFNKVNINRSDFCSKYARSSIMNKMSDDIYENHQ